MLFLVSHFKTRTQTAFPENACPIIVDTHLVQSRATRTRAVVDGYASGSQRFVRDLLTIACMTLRALPAAGTNLSADIDEILPWSYH